MGMHWVVAVLLIIKMASECCCPKLNEKYTVAEFMLSVVYV